jgi:hypothetical protein
MDNGASFLNEVFPALVVTVNDLDRGDRTAYRAKSHEPPEIEALPEFFPGM